MNRLKTRVERLSGRIPTEQKPITITHRIVDHKNMDREPNIFSCMDKDITITSEAGETENAYVARVRELTDSRVIRILAQAS
jgi:hypothetical protein